MEKLPSFSRIVGGTREQKAALHEEAEKESSLSGEELFGGELMEPTEEEKSLIDTAVTYSNDIALHYGSRRIVDSQRVFVLKEGAVLRLTDGDIAGGISNRMKQSIGVERKMSPLLFAMTVVHEACHGASYSSAQILEDGTNRPYRQGISMREINGENTYFKHAEEAIVETLAKRFYDEVLSRDPRYEEEISRTNEIKEWLASFIKKNAPTEKQMGILSLIHDILVLPESEEMYEVILDSSLADDYKFGYFQGKYQEVIESGGILLARNREREAFDSVLERISQKSNGSVTKQELFEDFARAHFTSNYLPLAKKIESIMGKGSFREIATELGIAKLESNQNET